MLVHICWWPPAVSVCIELIPVQPSSSETAPAPETYTHKCFPFYLVQWSLYNLIDVQSWYKPAIVQLFPWNSPSTICTLLCWKFTQQPPNLQSKHWKQQVNPKLTWLLTWEQLLRFLSQEFSHCNARTRLNMQTKFNLMPFFSGTCAASWD